MAVSLFSWFRLRLDHGCTTNMDWAICAGGYGGGKHGSPREAQVDIRLFPGTEGGQPPAQAVARGRKPVWAVAILHEPCTQERARQLLPPISHGARCRRRARYTCLACELYDFKESRPSCAPTATRPRPELIPYQMPQLVERTLSQGLRVRTLVWGFSASVCNQVEMCLC